MVSYILFVDDYLVVAKATVKDVGCLKAILDVYYSISGQARNLTNDGSVCQVLETN